ncbi:aminotransferase class III-fold pyridoxal phosphate-dependent enzyme [Egibacter rhizosphaerae]|uniref:Aminotransferase class III-fold pyridoxal phosphate-dependent enzyme n=1 Tax=Egibacter rhizosphaerae TaxID=1670831 RepID=A0A411YIQ3_9ACTN|nr:aminotransferase class III-fold pyridoxal phosphate-dependent enzyme [Egibacter rhizosphaerae]QBI21148.1 aminotransferase class III-fold pyridoxal phosphate-dependent enzyme [Egibacter rhizosphaerae]
MQGAGSVVLRVLEAARSSRVGRAAGLAPNDPTPEATLAEWLTALSPFGAAGRGNGGTWLATDRRSALEGAVRLARLATGRHQVVTWWDAQEAAAHRVRPDGGTDGGSPGDEASPLLIRGVLEHAGDLGAVVVAASDPALRRTSPWFWHRLHTACRSHGAPLIVDGSEACLGRTGHLFASEPLAGLADLFITGEALGGGESHLAAVTAGPAILRAASEAGEPAHGALIRDSSTNHLESPVTRVPVHPAAPPQRAASVGLATLDVIAEEGLSERAAELGVWWGAELTDVAERHPHVEDVVGDGLLWALMLAPRGSCTDSGSPAEAVRRAAWGRGLSCGVANDRMVTLAPPLTVMAAELHRASDIVDVALRAVARAPGGSE